MAIMTATAAMEDTVVVDMVAMTTLAMATPTMVIINSELQACIVGGRSHIPFISLLGRQLCCWSQINSILDGVKLLSLYTGYL